MALPDDASSDDDQEGKVEPQDAVSDPDVDNNVIAGDEDENIARKDESAVTPPKTPPPPSIPLPMLTNLSDLTLNSPSSMIVGTPFSDSNTRFEYPFPDNVTSDPPANTSPQNSPTFSSLSSSPSSSALVSMSQPQLVPNAPPTLQHYPASFPPPSDLPSYSPTHPKMRAVDPPVPPALVKRRQRFSLGLGAISRKLSLRSGSAPTSPGDVGHRRAMSDERANKNKSGTLTPTRQDGPSKDGGESGTYT
ncbi:hypothetical protein DFH06DRAFT_1139547 [Mycena polygramma]|nr:hypothetical protein DFH06DRAFT_1139547 [Mycena polygramma]